MVWSILITAVGLLFVFEGAAIHAKNVYPKRSRGQNAGAGEYVNRPGSCLYRT